MEIKQACDKHVEVHKGNQNWKIFIKGDLSQNVKRYEIKLRVRENVKSCGDVGGQTERHTFVGREKKLMLLS